MTIRIIQKDTWSCFACVAAMITGRDAADVFKFIGHDGSGHDEKSEHPEKRRAFDWVEILKYLLEYRYTLGMWSIFEDGADLTDIDEIDFKIKIKEHPAIMQVPSTRLGGNCQHVIYWDGGKLFDPSPAAKEDPKFSDYKVLSFIPVLHFE